MKYLSKTCLIVFLCLFFSQSTFAQRFKFEYLTIKDGLSQNSAFAIAEDEQGFLWFATQDGLNKYDGYDFTVYKPSAQNSNSISYNEIRKLHIDKSNKIWIGTLGGGLSSFNTKTSKFEKYRHNSKNENSLSNNFVTAINETSDGLILVGTQDGVLNILNKSTGNFTKIPIRNASGQIFSILNAESNNVWVGYKGGFCKVDLLKKKISEEYLNRKSTDKSEDKEVRVLYKDSYGIFWVGTNDGLFVFNTVNHEFTKFINEQGRNSSLSHNSVNCIYETKSKQLWIGTEGGLNIYNRQKNCFFTIINDPNDPTSLSNNNINAIFEDRFGIMWFGTYGSGINKWDSNQKKFVAYTNATSKYKDFLINPIIFAINQDAAKNIWLGTYGGGITVLNRQQQTVKHLKYSKSAKNCLSNDLIRAIFIDTDGLVWIGTVGGGLNVYNPSTGIFKHYLNNPEDPNSISSNRVTSIFKDKSGIFWIGTFGGGINRFDPKTEIFEVIKHHNFDDNSLINNDVFNIKEDWLGNLWVATRDGLSKYNLRTKEFTNFSPNITDINSLQDSKVLCITIDKKRLVIWVGTGNGLSMINPLTNKIKTFTTDDGLPNNFVYSILMHKNNLWLSTNRGLSRFDPKTKITHNYTKGDGLESDEFNSNSGFMSSDGEMFFGGSEGFDAFYPDSILPNPFQPNMVITNLKIFNENISPGENSVLKSAISYSSEIVLKPSDYSFSIEFAALHFSSPFSNMHAYKLENFDKKWIYSESKIRIASYTNLDPGEYLFRVKGTNNEGVWSKEEKVLKIIILPPYWKTWWFRTLTVIFILSIVISYISIRTKVLKQQKEALEKQVQLRTIQIHQQKEELIAQSEQLLLTNIELEKLSIVASETESAVIIMDSECNYEWVNPGFNRLYGYTLDEFINIKGRNLLQSSYSSEINEILNESISTNQSVIYQNIVKTKSGEDLWVQTSLTPILNSDGSIHKFVAIDADINKLKLAEKEINEKNGILTSQRDELSAQKDKIEEMNYQLNSSIKYALQIQKSVLPIKQEIDAYFENAIIYRPRDIVSGDFYWFHPIEKKNDSTFKALIAAVDCTGHGVPGAFLSLIGNRILNEIVANKIYKPSQILEQLNIQINVALQQEKSANRDGMDVCLCLIEKNSDSDIQITYSGAKRPLYFYQNASKSFTILKGDRKKIGGFYNKRNNLDFTNQTIQLAKGDTIYLSTDGIIDQNTNFKRTKYGTTRLVSLLEEIAERTLMEQRTIISDSYNEFKGDEPQRDDVTFITIRF